jgi:hypothetical protein
VCFAYLRLAEAAKSTDDAACSRMVSRELNNLTSWRKSKVIEMQRTKLDRAELSNKRGKKERRGHKPVARKM